jgi:hypothetical protein
LDFWSWISHNVFQSEDEFPSPGNEIMIANQFLRRWSLLIVLLGFTCASLFSSTGYADAAPDECVLIECEHFDDYGGWSDDSQFIDQMGSTYLLAHGLGNPVEDAKTTVAIPSAGTYRVWARTRDWVATWNAPGAPGRFEITVNGKTLDAKFGTEGAEWHWQDGGLVEIDGTSADVALHDLTGFEGRCDAILFVPGRLQFTPPDAGPALTSLRRELLDIPEEPEDAGEYDLVVVGGGIAGVCSAVSAARCGLSVALIQDRPVLGGNNSSEVRVWLQGGRNIPPYPRVGDIVAEMEQARHAHYGPSNTADLYEDEKKIDLVEAEPNIDLRLMHRAVDVEMDGSRIAAVIAVQTHTGHSYRFTSRLVADCTGDGCLAPLAGADYEMSVPGHMGKCNLWNIDDTGQPIEFPECPWALDLSEKPFPGRSNQRLESLGGWYWESGFDHDPIEFSEYIRDWNFRAAYGAFDALKNVDNAFPNHRLNWMAYISGKRESRRIMGDVILSMPDLIDSVVYEDGCVPTGWKIDVHIPDQRYEEGFEGDAFISKALFTDYPKPYWIPYRTLYSRNIENLFMAGRDSSVTHDALGATRVMRTGGCMGEIVGLAATICIEEGTTPRGVYEDHLDALKEDMLNPAYTKPPEPLKLPEELEGVVGENIAPSASLAVSGNKTLTNSPLLLVDEQADLRDNGGRWISNQSAPAWVEFRWETPQKIAAARIISGYAQGGGFVAPIEDFVIQYADGTVTWREIPATQTTGNDAIDWSVAFDAVETDCIRVLITKTQDDWARVWEVSLYEVP